MSRRVMVRLQLHDVSSGHICDVWHCLYELRSGEVSASRLHDFHELCGVCGRVVLVGRVTVHRVCGGEVVSGIIGVAVGVCVMYGGTVLDGRHGLQRLYSRTVLDVIEHIVWYMRGGSVLVGSIAEL